MVLSPGLTKLVIGASVPDDKNGTVPAKDWVAAAIAEVTGTVSENSNAKTATAEKLGDTSEGKNEFPIKLLDIAKSGAFKFLRSKGALKDDDSDDEPCLTFDDDL